MINLKMGRMASIALIAPLVLGAGRVDSNLVLQPESRLWIAGTSTVRPFECTANSVDVNVETTGVAAVAAVLGGQNAVTGATVNVPSKGLDCRNGTMNEHMLKALKADQHPQVTFRVDSYDLVPNAGGSNARLNGTLTMGGVAKVVSIDSDARSGGDGVLRVTGKHTVKMSEFGLKRPSLMLGTIKVGDDVQVHFDLLLK